MKRALGLALVLSSLSAHAQGVHRISVTPNGITGSFASHVLVCDLSPYTQAHIAQAHGKGGLPDRYDGKVAVHRDGDGAFVLADADDSFVIDAAGADGGPGSSAWAPGQSGQNGGDGGSGGHVLLQTNSQELLAQISVDTTPGMGGPGGAGGPGEAEAHGGASARAVAVAGAIGRWFSSAAVAGAATSAYVWEDASVVSPGQNGHDGRPGHAGSYQAYVNARGCDKFYRDFRDTLVLFEF